MSDPENADLPTSPRLHAYTSMWRLRGDAWASLADLTKRLSDALTPEDQRPALRDEVSELVRLLDPRPTGPTLAAPTWSGSPHYATWGTTSPRCRWPTP
jgi:hypothetical protein